MESLAQDQTKRILDFKTSDPSYILPSLQIISKHRGNWRRIQDELVRFARSLGSKASAENVVSAYVTPTLRNLRLVSGQGQTLELTPDGRQCLEAHSSGGEDAYLRRLGLQLILVDRDSGGIFEFLAKEHSSPSSGISIDGLKRELSSLGHREALGTTRVSSWITFLKFVGLVRLNERSQCYASLSQHTAILQGDPEISNAEFEESLWNHYRLLKPLARGSPYVPIPTIREAVCNEFSMSSFKFDKILKSLIASPGMMRVIPATPIEPKEGGLAIGKKYYYSIAVYGQAS